MSDKWEFNAGSAGGVMTALGRPDLTIQMDALGIVPMLIPATAIGLFNDSIIIGHDATYRVVALQADQVTPFSLFESDGVTVFPINYYGKINPSDTTLLFSKTSALNPSEIVVPNPVNGVINVTIRAVNFNHVAVGTTIFQYVDIINPLSGNPVNISKFTLTITN